MLLALLLACAFVHADSASVDYLHYHIAAPTDEDELVRHVFEVLDNRIAEQGAPAGQVRGQVIVGMDGAGLKGVHLGLVAKQIGRVLEGGQVIDDLHYTIERSGWVGLSFRSVEDFTDRVAEERLRLFGPDHEDENLPEPAMQALCEFVLRAPVRH